MAQEAKMSDNDFCAMIHEWTGVNLDTRVGDPPQSQPDNRPTIRDLLLSGKNKDDFFTLSADNERELLKEWAKDCGFKNVKCGVIASHAVKQYGESGT